jgi:hypothetical protein
VTSRHPQAAACSTSRNENPIPLPSSLQRDRRASARAGSDAPDRHPAEGCQSIETVISGMETGKGKLDRSNDKLLADVGSGVK